MPGRRSDESTQGMFLPVITDNSPQILALSLSMVILFSWHNCFQSVLGRWLFVELSYAKPFLGQCQDIAGNIDKVHYCEGSR